MTGNSNDEQIPSFYLQIKIILQCLLCKESYEEVTQTKIFEFPISEARRLFDYNSETSAT